MTTVTLVKSAVINRNKLELQDVSNGTYVVKMNGLHLATFTAFPEASDFFRVLVNAALEVN